MRRVLRFLREVKVELVDKNQSLPNPPAYEAEMTRRSAMVWRERIEKRVAAYVDTWKNEDAERRRAKMLELAKEQKTAAEDLARETRGAMNDAEKPLREYITGWVNVYQEAVQSFVEGYKEGRQGDPVEGEGAAEGKLADDAEAKEANSAETSTTTPQTPPDAGPLPAEKEPSDNDPTKR